MDDDIDETLALLLIYRRKLSQEKKTKRLWVHPTIATRKECGEYERLIQELRLDNDRFFKYFRMEVDVFDDLLRRVGPKLIKKNSNFRDPIQPSQRLAVTLRYENYYNTRTTRYF